MYSFGNIIKLSRVRRSLTCPVIYQKKIVFQHIKYSIY